MPICCVDSICVKFLSEGKILYGLGNNLCLLNGQKQTFCEVKPRDKIHLVEYSGKSVICSAGREILYAELEDVSGGP
jgi:hypothetical protein